MVALHLLTHAKAKFASELRDFNHNIDILDQPMDHLLRVRMFQI
jgi:hypothetical protein